MAGDTIQIGARAFYKSVAPVNTNQATPEEMAASLLNAFAGSLPSVEETHMSQVMAEQLPGLGSATGSDFQQLTQAEDDITRYNRPRAYLNFALFDDQFNLVEGNSGVRQVHELPDSLQTLAVDKMLVERTGFLYVYTSNESGQDVYMDNRQAQCLLP